MGQIVLIKFVRRALLHRTFFLSMNHILQKRKSGKDKEELSGNRVAVSINNHCVPPSRAFGIESSLEYLVQHKRHYGNGNIFDSLALKF